MGDHHDGLGEALAGDLHQSQHILAGAGVQVAGGLVGQEDGGLGGQGPCDGHPLLLAAGEVVGQALEFFLQAQGGDDLVQVALVRLLPIQLDGEDDVLPYAEHRHQVVRLEHKPDLPPPENGQGLIFQGEDVLSVHSNSAGGGPVQAPQHVEQGRLAGTGGPHHRHELPFFHGEVHPVQGADLGLPRAVDLAQVFGL